jgi:hypothetical protein
MEYDPNKITLIYEINFLGSEHSKNHLMAEPKRTWSRSKDAVWLSVYAACGRLIHNAVVKSYADTDMEMDCLHCWGTYQWRDIILAREKALTEKKQAIAEANALLEESAVTLDELEKLGLLNVYRIVAAKLKAAQT